MNFRLGALVASLMLGGCVPRQPRPSDTQIVTRIKSPDGTLEAIYAEDVGGGAAVGTTEEVFIVPPGAFPRLKERVFSEECARDIALRWQGSRALVVDYTSASDAREHTRPYGPSPLSLISLLSSGYWTFSEPHGAQIRFIRRIAPANGGC